MLYPEIVRGIEKKVGLTMAELRAMPLAEFRTYIEKRNGKKVEFRSYLPLIGRGTVAREVLTEKELNCKVDEALAKL